MKRFPGKRIFITGSGSGLGRALALRFAREGWRVGVSDIDAARMEESARLVREAGGSALSIACNVTDAGDLDRAARAVAREWGGLDILVNNAGVAAGGLFERVPPDRWDWIFAVNFRGVVHGCQSFIPMFKAQRNGHIVNVASCAGIVSLPEMASYNATKAAVISVSETLRTELAAYRVGVTVVCPTFIKTGLMESFHSPDELQRARAERFFDASRYSPERFADFTFRAIRKNRLYAFPQFDGRMAWRMKRLFPELFYRYIARRYAKEGR
ncbi:MAG: SDR family oxidoreductase [Spirochaetes bacterium]|nr:MAG: SDR family oxidoreductase [Spirochaetota bacterium]